VELRAAKDVVVIRIIIVIMVIAICIVVVIVGYGVCVYHCHHCSYHWLWCYSVGILVQGYLVECLAFLLLRTFLV